MKIRMLKSHSLFQRSKAVKSRVCFFNDLQGKSVFTGSNNPRGFSTRKHQPLRILFCGSDDFSSASLRALNDLRIRDSQLIASIDVLCRPGKRYGRNLKYIREVPVKAVAREIGLTIHERDTFTGWQLPEVHGQTINLIIAVSFGLFIPGRVLKTALYSGLNVHPSLLPDFRGPAPLQHHLLAGEEVTGVTIQSLDDKNFDHGIILAQERHSIPRQGRCTYQDLLHFIKPKAASLLRKAIEDRRFILPRVAIKEAQSVLLRHAPKITTEHREIDWRHWCSLAVDRRCRALGRLWSNIWPSPNRRQRFVFEDFEIVARPPALNVCTDLSTHHKSIVPGMARDIQFLVYSLGKVGERGQRPYVDDGDAIIIATRNGGAIKVREITIEGHPKRAARKAMLEFAQHS